MKYITLIAAVFLPVLTIANPFKIVIESSDLGIEGGNCTDRQSYCATHLVDQQGYSIEQLQEYSKKQGGPTDEKAIKDSLFICRGGYYVVWEEQCDRGCHVSASNSDDRCKYGYESNSGKSDNGDVFQVKIGL